MTDQPEMLTISLADLMAHGDGYPYVLIKMEPHSDGSGEPALTIKAGNGAEEQPLALVSLVICETPAEDNPIAGMLREIWNDTQLRDARQGVKAVVDQMNPDWLPYVTGN